MFLYQAFIADPHPLHWGWECHCCKNILHKVLVWVTVSASHVTIELPPGWCQLRTMVMTNGESSTAYKWGASSTNWCLPFPLKLCDWLLLFILDLTFAGHREPGHDMGHGTLVTLMTSWVMWPSWAERTVGTQQRLWIQLFQRWTCWQKR